MKRPTKADAIRSLLRDGMSPAAIADQVGVRKAYVWQVRYHMQRPGLRAQWAREDRARNPERAAQRAALDRARQRAKRKAIERRLRKLEKELIKAQRAAQRAARASRKIMAPRHWYG
jgi:hypothetical protein